MEIVKFVIEKGVPIVEPRYSRKPEYPFDEMEVGDSFVADVRGATSAAATYGKNHKMKFISRKTKEGSYRIWRVE